MPTTSATTPSASPSTKATAAKTAQKSSKKATPAKRLAAADVLAYLQKHPQFFTDHAEQLSALSQPKKAGNLLSLHAFQAGKAEKEAQRLSVRHQQMVSTAHANAVVAGAIFESTLQALSLTSLGQLRTWLQTELPQQLNLNATRLFLVADETTTTTLAANSLASICPNAVTLRTLTQAAERDMYGPKGKLISSDALLRLDNPTNGAPMAVLALGSTDKTRFHAGQSTELATFFARALAIRLHQMLQLKG